MMMYINVLSPLMKPGVLSQSQATLIIPFDCCWFDVTTLIVQLLYFMDKQSLVYQLLDLRVNLLFLSFYSLIH